MTIKEIFEHERYLAATCSAYMPWGVEEMLDRIEKAVNERIAELEAQVPEEVKPIIHPDNYCAESRFSSASGWRCECPMCHQQTGIYRGMHYCHSCGVKFNWGAE